MTKPRNDDRIATAIRFDPELHAKLVKAAGERDISVNYLVNAAVKDYVARLIPIEELSLVRQPEPKTYSRKGHQNRRLN